METLISQLPTPQAQKCATFTPPLDLLADPTATVTDVYEWNAIHNPNHPLFIFDDDGVAKSISWKEANQGVHRAAHYFTNYLPSHCNDTNVPTVIAMLATLGKGCPSLVYDLHFALLTLCQDSITFGCSLIGSIRAGFVAFLISPRNSSEAIAHLLTESNSKALFISADRPMADLAEAAVKQLQRDSTTSPIDVHPMPVFEDLFPPQPDLDFKPFLPRKMNLDAPAFILHSSGSSWSISWLPLGNWHHWYCRLYVFPKTNYKSPQNDNVRV